MKRWKTLRLLLLFGSLCFTSGKLYGRDGFLEKIKIGVKAGLNIAKVVDIQDQNFPTGVIGFTVGWQAGMFAQMNLTEKLTFQPELVYSVKGYSDLGSSAGENYSQYLYYVEFPLQLKYSLGKNYSLIGGIYIATYTGGHSSFVTTTNSNSPIVFPPRDAFDGGLIIGVDKQWGNGLNISFRYSQGLQNIVSNYTSPIPGIPQYNMVFSICVGWLFK